MKVLEIGELEFEPDFEFSDGLRVSVTYAEEFSSARICNDWFNLKHCMS